MQAFLFLLIQHAISSPTPTSSSSTGSEKLIGPLCDDFESIFWISNSEMKITALWYTILQVAGSSQLRREKIQALNSTASKTPEKAVASESLKVKLIALIWYRFVAISRLLKLSLSYILTSWTFLGVAKVKFLGLDSAANADTSTASVSLHVLWPRTSRPGLLVDGIFKLCYLRCGMVWRIFIFLFFLNATCLLLSFSISTKIRLSLLEGWFLWYHIPSAKCRHSSCFLPSFPGLQHLCRSQINED